MILHFCHISEPLVVSKCIGDKQQYGVTLVKVYTKEVSIC